MICLIVFIVDVHKNLNYNNLTSSPVELGVICKVISAGILIFSIYWIRSLVNKVQNGKISSRETVMTAHTICFSLVILANVLATVMLYFEENTVGKINESYCRLYATQVVIEIIARALNVVILLLFFFVAATLCKPITSYIQSVL